MMHTSSKTYGHEVGLSCCFRQWRARSHCRFLHGYALKVRLQFRSAGLDENGWVMDFGALKPVKAMLEDLFDHKTLVAEDDPDREHFEWLDMQGIIQMRVVPRTGCEAFATLIHGKVAEWLAQEHPPVMLMAVEVAEHGANAAEVTL